MASGYQAGAPPPLTACARPPLTSHSLTHSLLPGCCVLTPPQVHGTCLGFEALSIIVSRNTSILSGWCCGAEMWPWLCLFLGGRGDCCLAQLKCAGRCVWHLYVCSHVSCLPLCILLLVLLLGLLLLLCCLVQTWMP